MLKREESKEIINGVKIKIPTIDEMNKLMKRLNKIAKTEVGDIDYDNPKVIYFLFKKLVISDMKDIKNINEEQFMEAYYNPTPEMEIICFEIGKVISNAIKSMLRNNISQLMEAELRIIQAEAITRIDSMTQKAKEIKEIKE